MATKTFYLLNTAAATPNFFGNLQEGGSAPTAANSTYGWTVAKGAISSPFWRGRHGASTAVASGAGLASSWIASNNPTKGTAATNTAAGDSFISPVTYAGTFANTNWTFSFNMRASVAGAVGRIRLNVYRSANADGTSATKLTSTVQVGSTITLSTSADTNSSITWAPGGTITLANEYLFIQPEWEETTAGSSTTSNVLFRIGTASFTTSDYTATTAVAFSNDWTTGTPSIPSNMTFTRASARRYFNSSGVLSSASTNTARFNYTWDGSAWTLAGLLIEEQRTNSCYNSDLTAWSNPGAGNTVTAATGLDGTSDAYLVVPSTGSGSHMTYLPGASITTANPVTYSTYVKASGYTKVAIRECVGSGTGYNFDLASGGSVIGSFNSNANLAVSNPTIEAVGSGGWFRITFRITPTGSQGLGFGCVVVDNSFTSGDPWGSYSFAGNGTSGAVFDTPQLEEGLTASSSIRTTGSGVAASADILSSTDIPSILNLGYVVETIGAPSGIAETLLGINTIVGLGFDTSNHLTTADGGTQTTSATRNIGTRNSSGIAFDSTPRVSISLNGSTATTAANTPATVTALYFGCTNNGASGFLNGHLRKINGYTTLTDAALATNTSLATGTSGDGSATGSNAATAVGAWLQAGVGSSAGANTTTAAAAPIQSKPGSSAGSNAATAVGSWLQSGVGSSAGANTSTAVGQAAVNAPGSSAGSNVATAVGAWLQAGVGSSAGANTAAATAAPLQARPGTSAGTNAATAVGAWLQSGVGASAGANTATSVGSWLQAGIGSSTGTNTATATGRWLQSGVGSATGANTATGIGSWLFSGVGASVGSNTATASGLWLQSGVGSSAGTNTTTATGRWLQSGVGNAQGDNTSSGYSPGVSNVGSSSGTNTATGVGAWLQASVGSSAGANVTAATGGWLQSGIGSSTGANAAAAIGAWLQAGVGSSVGTNTTSGVSAVGGVVTGDGLAVGANIALAIGAWLQTATGTAIGGNVADAVSGNVTEADFNNDFAEDFAGYPGHILAEASFNDDFNNDFPTYVTPFIVQGVGFSAGGNIATAVSTTEVFIPPVYPPVVVPVKVWHPAQEYHRVQAPRATRVYRHGTELRRRPPQGMKRRYG